jgi:hypothetical protein
MKKKIFYSCLFLMAVLWTGCKKNNSQDARDIFVATYSVTESWTENGQVLTKPAYTMTIQKSTQQIDKLLLSNFADYGTGVTAEATVNGLSLIIPQQTLSNSKSIIGTGTLVDPTLTFTYTENFNSISLEISAIAKKK